MKKFFALLLAAMMVVSLFAGCGSSAPAENNDAPQANASATPIKVGTSGPLTNDYAVYGKAVEYGLTLAFEEINALGGLQFELRAEDDEADGEMAVNAYNALMDWGMQIMAGPTTSGSAAAAAAECAADGVFMLTPSASDASVIAAGDNVFQICFTDPNQGIGSADFIFSHALGEKVGIIYDSSNPYSLGIYNKFVEQANNIGLVIVAEEAFTADNKADLTTQVTKCKEAGADLVFLPIYAAEAAQVLTCADKIGYDVPFFGCDGLDGILGKVSDPAIAENVLMLTPFAADSTEADVQAFVAGYQAAYNATPDQFAASGYDTIYAIKAAVEKANVTSADADLSSKVVAAMKEVTVDGVTGTMTWGEDGETTKAAQAMIIHDGVASLYAAG